MKKILLFLLCCVSFATASTYDELVNNHKALIQKLEEESPKISKSNETHQLLESIQNTLSGAEGVADIEATPEQLKQIFFITAQTLLRLNDNEQMDFVRKVINNSNNLLQKASGKKQQQLAEHFKILLSLIAITAALDEDKNVATLLKRVKATIETWKNDTRLTVHPSLKDFTFLEQLLPLAIENYHQAKKTCQGSDGGGRRHHGTPPHPHPHHHHHDRHPHPPHPHHHGFGSPPPPPPHHGQRPPCGPGGPREGCKPWH